MSEPWYRNEVDRLRKELAQIGRGDGNARHWTSPTLQASNERELAYLRGRLAHKRTSPRLAKLKGAKR